MGLQGDGPVKASCLTHSLETEVDQGPDSSHCLVFSSVAGAVRCMRVAGPNGKKGTQVVSGRPQFGPVHVFSQFFLFSV